MLLPWLRQLAESRYKSASRRRPLYGRLQVETLEERSSPATVTWTGAAMPDPNTGDALINGTNRWSSLGNWQGGNIPVDNRGDDVIFPDLPDLAAPGPGNFKVAEALPGPIVPPHGIGPRNDLGTLRIRRLEIRDQNWDIGGNALEITEELFADFTGLPSNLGNNIIIPAGPGGSAGVLPIRIANANAVLNLNNGISEITPNSGFIKLGPGTLGVGGTSTYTGLTEVNTGFLDVLSAAALGGTVQGTQVRDGATVRTFVNIGQLLEPLEITGAGVGGTAGALSGSGTWDGPITLLNTASIGATGIVTVNGIISSTGSGVLNKVTPGTVVFTNSNTYQRDTLVNAGILRITNNNALAPGDSTTVANGATLQLRGNITVGTETLLTLNGAGAGGIGAFAGQGGALTNAFWVTPIFLATSSSVGGDRFSIVTVQGDGNFAGPNTSNLTKVDEGTFILEDANAQFLGATTINRGTLIVRDALALGPSTGGAILVNNPGTFQLEGSYIFNKALTLNGFGFENTGALRTVIPGTTIQYAAPITLGSDVLVGQDTNTTLNVTGAIGGGAAANLTKSGNGTMILAAANTYLGATTLREGLVIIRQESALGGLGGAGTTVQNGTTLQVEGASGITVQGEVLTLSGLGLNGTQGALRSVNGTNVFTGAVNLLSVTGATQTNIAVVGDSVNFASVVGGSADLLKTGAGTLILSGTANNTTTGDTIVNEGLLLLSKSAGLLAIGDDLIVGDGLGGMNADITRLTANGQLPTNRNVRVNSSGLFDLNNNTSTIGSLTLQGGNVTTGTGTLRLNGNVTSLAVTPNQSATISGNLSLGTATRTFTVAPNAAGFNDLIVNAVISQDTGSTAGLSKAGLGRLVLNNVNTYNGATGVNQGVLTLGVSNALPDTTALSLGAAGTLELNNNSDTVGSLSGLAGAQILLGSGRLTSGGLNTSTTYSGTVTGTGGLTKVGTGTLTLDTNSTGYTGSTQVNGGTLLVNANYGNATAQVGTGATLGGTGTVGATNVAGGTITGGTATGAGRLNVNGNLMLDSATTYLANINGTTVGTGFDQLNVTGNVNLNDATLSTQFGFNGAVGDSFTIVSASGSLTGLFKDASGSSLTDGETFVDNGRVYQIDYTSNSVVVNLVAIQSATTVVSSLNPSQVGQNVTFTATVSSVAPGAPTPTGTVTFFFDADPSDMMAPTQIGMAQTLSGGQASVSTTTLPGGSLQITAVYSGSATFLTSTGTQTPNQQVNRATSVTTVVGAPTTTVFGENITFTVTVAQQAGVLTPTGMVTLVDVASGNTLGTGTLSGGTATVMVTTLDAGMRTVRADYAGDTSFNPSSGTTSQIVNRADTTTMVTSSDNSTVFGEPVTFTATVTSNSPSTAIPSGTVTFTTSLGGMVLGTATLDGTGVATLTVTNPPVGLNQTITATFNTNNNFNSSTATVTQNVAQGMTTTTLATSGTPSVFGQPVTFTATVAPVAPSTRTPTGTVTFVNQTSGATLGTGTLNAMGQATFTLNTLPVGTFTIRGDYTDASGNYAGSSGTVSQTVNTAATTTTVTSSINPSVFGQPTTISAIVSAAPGTIPPTGTVNFTINGQAGPANVQVVNGVASFTTSSLALGASTITAAYTSNSGNFQSSTTTAPFNQLVNPAPTTINLMASRPASAPGQPVTFTAVVSAPNSVATPSGTITLLVNNTPVGSLAANAAGTAVFTLTNLPAGTSSVRAQFTPNSPNFLPGGSGSLSQIVRTNFTAFGANAGAPGQVTVRDGSTGATIATFAPYGMGFTGGVRVALGDVNGDGLTDLITAAGPGAGPHVKVFSLPTLQEVASFFAYGAGFNGGVNVAAGDLDNDGRDEIFTGAGPGAPGGHAKVFRINNGAPQELASFLSFGIGFNGGISVAAGDINGNGRADIIVGAGAGAGGGHVKVFSDTGFSEIASFLAYDPSFLGGANVASGDTTGDGRDDIIVGAVISSPHVKVFDGVTRQERASFLAFPGAPIGVRVSAGDVNGDGVADILVGAANSAPHVRIFAGNTLAELNSFFALLPVFGNGIFVAGLT